MEALKELVLISRPESTKNAKTVKFVRGWPQGADPRPAPPPWRTPEGQSARPRTSQLNLKFFLGPGYGELGGSRDV